MKESDFGVGLKAVILSADLFLGIKVMLCCTLQGGHNG